MVDFLSPRQRSAVMAAIRSKGNKSTELRLVKILKDKKIRGWRRGSKLPGRPDFVFPLFKLAIFVDGDFWHGNPRTVRMPKSRMEFWALKIKVNRARDRRVNRQLRALGWKVLRIWESSLAKEPNRTVSRIIRIFGKNRNE